VSETIRVAIDFNHPAAYLAIEPTRALETRLGQTFDWLPYRVPPLPQPKPASPDDDRGARHSRIRSEYLARDLRRYAGARGIDLGNLYREADIQAASLGLLWIRRHAPGRAGEYVARIFDRIWRENAPADLAFIEAAMTSKTSGFHAYAANDGPRELAELRAEFEALAVWNVPAFIVGEELFLGRQHLPIVEWLATGRNGPPPI
jgi:2-hydroxychromene-2-carboxylate isomerase